MKVVQVAFFVMVWALTTVSCQDRKTWDSRSVELVDEVEWLVRDTVQQQLVLDSLFHTAMAVDNTAQSRVDLLTLASQFDKFGRESDYLKLVNRARYFSKANSDTTNLAKSLWYLAELYEKREVLDSTYYFYKEAEKLYVAQGDSVNAGEMMLSKAAILYDFGVYSESEIQTIKALRYLKSADMHSYKYQCYQLLALTLCELKSFEEALDYYELTRRELSFIAAKQLFEPQDVSVAYGALYNNIGGVYEVKKDFEQALEFYDRGLSVAGLEVEEPVLYAALLNNKAFSQMQLSDTLGVSLLLKKASAIRKEWGSTHELISSELTWGEFYLGRKQIQRGLQHLNTALDLAKQMGSKPEQRDALRLLIASDSLRINAHTQAYVKVLDEISLEERAAKSKFARIAYETEKVAYHNHNLQQRMNKTILFSAVAIVGLLFLLLLLKLKSRNKQLKWIQKEQIANDTIDKLISKQQKKEELARSAERNRIAKELHDGIVNRIFTTRFNLMQLEVIDNHRKDLLVGELVKAEEEVRTISHQIAQSTTIDSKSFENAIQELIDLQQNSFGTQFTLTVDPFVPWELMSNEVRIGLFRILQEGLQNVNKYSKALKCEVLVARSLDGICCAISDNGVGFELDKAKLGLGLKNIEERLNAMGGQLTIKTQPGQGTELQLCVPLSREVY